MKIKINQKGCRLGVEIRVSESLNGKNASQILIESLRSFLFLTHFYLHSDSNPHPCFPLRFDQIPNSRFELIMHSYGWQDLGKTGSRSGNSLV